MRSFSVLDERAADRPVRSPLHWAVWLGLGSLVLAFSVGVVALGLAAFAACDVGVNASANSFAALFYFPAALALNSALVLMMVGLLRLLRFGALGVMVGSILALLIAAVLIFATMFTPADYPDPICLANVPPWWPSWLPS